MTIRTTSVAQTLKLGALIGELAAAGSCIALEGDLGAGKTQLTRGIALGAKVEDPTLVSSPTYVLLNIYQGAKPVYHLDAYRIHSEEDFEAVGLEELLKSDGIVVIEWPSRIPHLLPPDHLRIEIMLTEKENEREFTFTATGAISGDLAAEVGRRKRATKNTKNTKKKRD